MEAIFNSFILVFIGEIGDKTQLLALVLALKYKRPWVIIAGIFVATIFNHALAAWGGSWVSAQISPMALSWMLAVVFIFFAGWILVPDKEGELKESANRGVFITTTISFFLAEMGDKTQFATVALAARYSNVFLVTIGTTIGMLASNAMAIFLGEKLLSKIPMKLIRIISSLLFFLFGIFILISFYRK